MQPVREKAKGRRQKGGSILWIVLLIAMLIPAASFGQQQPPPKPAAQDGFVPIDQLAPKEELPAAPLVMAAYAVAWLVVFAYIWSLWRRLQRVEAEIADVNRRITSGARR
jgi:CcmD family protein